MHRAHLHQRDDDMGLNPNPIAVTPQLGDLLNELKRKIFLELNCHAVGTIQHFYSATQSVKLTLNYTKTAFQINPKNGATTYQQYPYPVLDNVPVVILQGGPAYLNMPIAVNDQCLVLFNDRDMDNWANGQTSGQVNSTRLHSLSDAIAIVGLKQFTKTISTYDATRALLSDGNASVGINPSNHKATIENTAQGTLGTVLQKLTTTLSDLLSALNTAFAKNAVNGSPLDPTWVTDTTGIVSDISGAVTAITGLLE